MDLLQPNERRKGAWKPEVSERARHRRSTRPSRAKARPKRLAAAARFIDLVKARLEIDDLKPLAQLMDESGLLSFANREAEEAANWWQSLKEARKARGGAQWTNDPKKQAVAYQMHMRDKHRRLSGQRLRYHSDDAYRKKCQEYARDRLKGCYENYQALSEAIRGRKQQLGCKICREANPDCLDFHHRDPREKRFTIGHAKVWNTPETLIAEMDKCDVLCSNCHRKHHAAERQE